MFIIDSHNQDTLYIMVIKPCVIDLDTLTNSCTHLTSIISALLLSITLQLQKFNFFDDQITLKACYQVGISASKKNIFLLLHS